MQQRAFSLVELSIVLVILGLLVGGIVAGQSLIRAAELRAVTTEYNRFTTAVTAFREQYFSYPGDLNNATKYWGTSPNCPGTYTQGSTGVLTCDGNNDGAVYIVGAGPLINEIFRFWQHLANAGLIEGTFSGVTAASNNYFWGVSSANSPASKIRNGLWSAVYMNNVAGGFSGAIFNYEYRPYGLVLGGYNADTTWNNTSIIKPEEAWNIDTKMDDGKPGSGLLNSRVGGNCNDATAGTHYDANYLLQQTGNTCFLIFRP